MQAYLPEAAELEVIGPHALRITFDSGIVRDIDFAHALSTFLSRGVFTPPGRTRHPSHRHIRQISRMAPYHGPTGRTSRPSRCTPTSSHRDSRRAHDVSRRGVR